jgi:hypothetical protein
VPLETVQALGVVGVRLRAWAASGSYDDGRGRTAGRETQTGQGLVRQCGKPDWLRNVQTMETNGKNPTRQGDGQRAPSSGETVVKIERNLCVSILLIQIRLCFQLV